jgi:nitrite reductase (NADH) small subunit
VTCPLHNWVIDLASGEAAAPDRGCVRRIPARVDGQGRVLLALGMSEAVR